MDTKALLLQAKQGFSQVNISDTYKKLALQNLEQWLTQPEFQTYVPQLQHMIEQASWDYVLDCFYQVIPFGTGGRRGEVGIGPNRINVWTIQSSAQGHSQYLLKKYGDEAKKRGVVMAYDVRQFFGNKYMSTSLPNPVFGLDGKQFSEAAAQVYAANGLKVFIFDSFRTTPELSFAIRHLKTVAGMVFSASHNPPEHNGKKVYDETGGQLIPPHDEDLVNEVQAVSGIQSMDFAQAKNKGLVQYIGKEVDEAYIQAGCALSLSKARDVNIVYTPLHGCGSTSVQLILRKLGFTIQVDPATSNPSGKFEHVTFNVPNPEVVQSFDSAKAFADSQKADIILNTDPDADRIGIMIRHQNAWKAINGNEIAAVLTRYVIEKRGKQVDNKGVLIKTELTTNLMTNIAKAEGVRMIGNLLVGFKYIGDEMNTLEKQGEIDNFLFSAEESHGYLAGNYVRDKDAVVAAVWLAELAAEQKVVGKTIVDYLNETYAKYGYFRNYLSEIRLPGAEGMTQIQQIQKGLRETAPKQFGSFEVDHIEDWMQRLPIVSETDKAAKNGLVFVFKPKAGTSSIRIAVRPSGTEPKIKMYYEIGSLPGPIEKLAETQSKIEQLVKEVEKSFMLVCYKLIGVDFPERGFLLFWQLPLKDKMHYFEIEEELANLKTESDVQKKKTKMAELLAFLGSDPVQKMNAAFEAKYSMGVMQYLGL